MRLRFIANGVAICALALLAGCAGSGGLRDLSSGSAGPDEFAVLPTAPLTIPDNLSILPRPTPGLSNPVDPRPKAAAIAALGGNPAAATAGGLPAADAGLVAYAGRAGVPGDIRATLATEDAAVRARALRFGLLGGDRYFRAYAAQRLDAYAELQRFRNAGVTTPSAPPLQ